MAQNWLSKTSQQREHDPFLSQAVEGGWDADKTPMYVGRARHECHYLPARVMPRRNFAYHGCNCHIYKVSNFDVLISDPGYAWVKDCNGNVPSNAVRGCRRPREQTDSLYIGRAMHEGVLCIGKVQPTHKCIYIPMNNTEIALKNYEVLVHSGCNHVPIWRTMCSTDALPGNAFQGGHETDCSPMYVGRTYFEGQLVPARVVTSETCAYIANEHKMYKKTDFDILAADGKYTWVLAWDGAVPPNAVSGCSSPNAPHEQLYIGRALHEGSLCIGKIHPSHKCIYLPLPNKEISLNSYEVLVHTSQHFCH